MPLETRCGLCGLRFDELKNNEIKLLMDMQDKAYKEHVCFHLNKIKQASKYDKEAKACYKEMKKKFNEYL